jgi:hypothetical protein
MISIYTHTNNPLKIEFWKWIGKKILDKHSGPDAVLDSLLKGLGELDILYELNPIKPKYDIVHVLSGTKALQKALEMKKKGRIKTLVAGPNLVITPLDQKKILCDPNIDIILLPSDWTKKFYSDLAPEITNKLYIWPAGTDMGNINLDNEKTGCVVYKKDVDDDLYLYILDKLNTQKINYTVIQYGKYDKKDYLKLLEKSKYMIYLQKVESQGLALQEAWARNVPTLVWNPTTFTYPQGYVVRGNISAPYLTEASGLFFQNMDDFQNKLEIFLQKIENFTPYKFCLENLSDKVSAEKYVNIIETFKK